MKTRYHFIHFINTGDRWFCINNKSGAVLGEVAWYPAWRQYIYEPYVDTVYSVGCLNDIAAFLDQISKTVPNRGKR